ncbi:MAG: C_GCAxxG_C_C family protein [Firmicutes bacterium]|nr:C_GCAxxG_C_C family protein [Bacillota bacterium]
MNQVAVRDVIAERGKIFVAGKHCSFICRELLDGCELITSEGQMEFKEKDLKNRVCRHCVRNVVEILEDIIWARS